MRYRSFNHSLLGVLWSFLWVCGKHFHWLLLFFLLGFGVGRASAQPPPSWLNPVVSPSPASPVVPLAPNPVAKKQTRQVARDTITKLDTIVKIDTVLRIDTIYPAKSLYYNYTVYYEIIQKKLALSKDFNWDYSNTAQKTMLQSSDTTLLSLGNENLREASYTYDNNGNKTQTFEKIIEGLDMRVNGDVVNVTYRTGSNLLNLNGRFDRNGLLMLSSDFSRRRYFLFFIPLDFLFGSEKYTLFLRLEKIKVGDL